MRETVKDWLDSLASNWGSDECLPFPFSVGSHGYGQFQSAEYGRKPVLAHRYMCQKFHGEAPDSTREAAHSCGNRLCVNPQHLRWATPKENQSDREAHGTTNKGERHGRAKLSLADVVAIRAAGGPQCDIAQQFGIKRQTVSDIKRGRRWTHLR